MWSHTGFSVHTRDMEFTSSNRSDSASFRFLNANVQFRDFTQVHGAESEDCEQHGRRGRNQGRQTRLQTMYKKVAA
jgi:hypothetical protein